MTLRVVGREMCIGDQKLGLRRRFWLSNTVLYGRKSIGGSFSVAWFGLWRDFRKTAPEPGKSDRSESPLSDSNGRNHTLTHSYFRPLKWPIRTHQEKHQTGVPTDLKIEIRGHASLVWLQGVGCEEVTVDKFDAAVKGVDCIHVVADKQCGGVVLVGHRDD